MNKQLLIAANALAFTQFAIASNEAIYLPADTGGGYAPGLIVAANESRFTQAFQSVPLTTYAVGWRDPSDITGQLDFLAPASPVEERFNYREFINSEEFLTDGDEDIRALGTDFKQVQYKSKETHDKVENKGLTYVEETRTLEKNPGRKQQIVDKLLRRILRNELIRAYTLHVGSSVSVNVTWTGNAAADADADLREQIGLSADDSGIRPNRVFFGEGAWDIRWRSYRAQNTAGSNASAGLTPDQLGAQLNAGLKVGNSRYQNTATAKSRIGGNVALLFTAEAGLDAEDPSNVKRFTALCDDGSTIRVFEQQLGPKLTAITVEHYSSIRITSTLGKRALIIT